MCEASDKLKRILDESDLVYEQHCRMLVNGAYPTGTILKVTSYEPNGVMVTQDGIEHRLIRTDEALPEECAYKISESYGAAVTGDTVIIFPDEAISYEYFDVYTLDGSYLGKIENKQKKIGVSEPYLFVCHLIED